MEAPQAPVPVSAQSNHWLDLLRFSLKQSIVTSLFDIGAGNYSLTSRPNESFLGAPSCGVRSSDIHGEYGSLRRYNRYSTQGTAGKAECDTRRVPPEHLARPISQACTGIAVQPAVKVLGPWRAHLQQMLKTFRASRTPRASSRGFHAKK